MTDWASVVHRSILPLMKKTGSLLDLPLDHRFLAMFSGAVSAVSWFYAAMLGIGRPLNWRYSLTELLAAYPILITGGFLGMLLLAAWARRRSMDGDSEARLDLPGKAIGAFR